MKLFEEKRDCCGCGTCAVACPKQAIEMVSDEDGFIYPQIQEEKCVSCGICQKVCAYGHTREDRIPQKVFAVQRKDEKKLRNSASGGAFAGLAEQWIEDGGIVFGAAMVKQGNALMPKHIAAHTVEELLPLLGSKYVQSDLNTTFIEAKKLLLSGKKVLYSGTPCQIAGLKSYLGREFEGLLTVDLVCHGVPSSIMFRDYQKVLVGDKSGDEIIEFKFRDKSEGWGLDARLGVYNARLGVYNARNIPSSQSSYYELFLRGDTYRDSCYHCPYANCSRVSDLTIGDFWGIEEEHPDYLLPQGYLNSKAGVSVLLINSEVGQKAFERFKNEFLFYPSTLEKAQAHNDQINHPSFPGDNRELVMHMYREKGYTQVDRWFWKRKNQERRKEWILHHIHNDIPEPLRKIAKKILRK